MTPIPVACLTLLLLVVRVPSALAASEANTEYPRAFDKPVPLDKPLFAIQIGSIIGAYAIFVAILLSLLLLVGRRLRRAVQSSNYSLQMEILQPAKSVSVDPSPDSTMPQDLPSPNRPNNFSMSWGSLAKAKASHPSTNNSAVTVDESVVASDRQRAQDEMEMLYAAVMEHDAQKAAGMDVSVKERDSQTQSPDSNHSNPFAGRSWHAPNGSSMPPKSPKPSKASRLSKLFNSNPNPAAESSKMRSPRLAVRKLPISPPLISPDMNRTRTYGQDEPPLSPRAYNPGPPPQAPQGQSRVDFAVAGRARPPAPLNLSPGTQSSSSLPFREAYPLQSAPATKTTILEQPVKNRNGPVTGMPTPYSPYMPFTPVTPFTPGRMVTKRQRKREERESGLRALDENDLVKDDQDMWG